jgi:hypothetical protein
MSELNIPHEHYAIFKFFVTLPRELKDQIIGQLKSAPVGLSSSAMIDYVSSNIEKLSKDRISDIFQIITGLIRAKENANVSIQEFLGLLSRGLSKTEVEELQPTEEIISDFEQILLNSVTMVATAKVTNEMTEKTKIFLEAKFFQDIRPVFDEEENLLGSAIIHNLKIIFKEDNEVKETFISLDDNDLDKLFTSLKNAKDKLEVIKNHFPNAKIIDIK